MRKGRGQRYRLMAMMVVGLLVGRPAESGDRQETVLDGEVFNLPAYEALRKREPQSLEEIVGLFELSQLDLLPAIWPEPEGLLRTATPTLLPFDFRNFDTAFIKSLVPCFKNGVTVWPLTVMEDSETRERVFFNAVFEEIATVPAPKDYDARWFAIDRFDAWERLTEKDRDWQARIYDPARIVGRFDLVRVEDLVKYVWAASAIPAWRGEEEEKALRVDESPAVTNIHLRGIAPASTGVVVSIDYPTPPAFTNLDIFVCDDVKAFAWTLADTILVDGETNAVFWWDASATGVASRAYAAGYAGQDDDADDLFNARERLVYGTDDQQADTDGDGVDDGEEVNDATDPTNENDPPNVSGAIAYNGGQTGLIWVVAVTDTNAWSGDDEVFLSETGAYHITQLSLTNYWIKAYRDTDGDGSKDLYEAWGQHAGGSLTVTGQVTGINLTLSDPDTDGDGLPDWWEQIYLDGLGQTAWSDYNLDGICNYTHYTNQTDPRDGLWVEMAGKGTAVIGWHVPREGGITSYTYAVYSDAQFITNAESYGSATTTNLVLTGLTNSLYEIQLVGNGTVWSNTLAWTQPTNDLTMWPLFPVLSSVGIPVNDEPSEVIVDNIDTSRVTVVGTWTLTTTAPTGQTYYGVHQLHDGNTGKGTKSVRFTPHLSAAGTYGVYLWWTAKDNRASNVPVDIVHAGGTNTVTVNQRINGSQWVWVGTYAFGEGTAGQVRIRTDGTDGYVFADAVRWVEVLDVPGGLCLVERELELESYPGWDSFYLSSAPDGADGWTLTNAMIKVVLSSTGGETNELYGPYGTVAAGNALDVSDRVVNETGGMDLVRFRLESVGTNTPGLDRALYLLKRDSSVMMEDGSPSVSGMIAYSGGQTGLIRVVAVTDSNLWSSTDEAMLSSTGRYHISQLWLTNYWLQAYRDSNSNTLWDTTEAWGRYGEAALTVTGQVMGINITLTDPDTDGDGLPDWWEQIYLDGLGQTAWSDYNLDGICNYTHYTNQTDPRDGLWVEMAGKGTAVIGWHVPREGGITSYAYAVYSEAQFITNAESYGSATTTSLIFTNLCGGSCRLELSANGTLWSNTLAWTQPTNDLTMWPLFPALPAEGIQFANTSNGMVMAERRLTLNAYPRWDRLYITSQPTQADGWSLTNAMMYAIQESSSEHVFLSGPGGVKVASDDALDVTDPLVSWSYIPEANTVRFDMVCEGTNAPCLDRALYLMEWDPSVMMTLSTVFIPVQWIKSEYTWPVTLSCTQTSRSPVTNRVTMSMRLVSSDANLLFDPSELDFITSPDQNATAVTEVFCETTEGTDGLIQGFKIDGGGCMGSVLGGREVEFLKARIVPDVITNEWSYPWRPAWLGLPYTVYLTPEREEVYGNMEVRFGVVNGPVIHDGIYSGGSNYIAEPWGSESYLQYTNPSLYVEWFANDSPARAMVMLDSSALASVRIKGKNGFSGPDSLNVGETGVYTVVRSHDFTGTPTWILGDGLTKISASDDQITVRLTGYPPQGTTSISVEYTPTGEDPHKLDATMGIVPDYSPYPYDKYIVKIEGSEYIEVGGTSVYTAKMYEVSSGMIGLDVDGDCDWTCEGDAGIVSHQNMTVTLLAATNPGLATLSLKFCPTGWTNGVLTNTLDIIILKVKSETVATTPSDRSRTDVGVAEQVNLTATPALDGMTWSTTSGSLSPTNGASTTFTAPEAAGNVVISLNVSGATCTKTFSVLEPNTVVHADIASTFSMSVGTAGAGMHLAPVIVGPTYVSFYRLEIEEVGEDASNITGYFTSNSPPSHIGHGADEWFSLNEDNSWPSAWDGAILGSADCPPPWSAGGFTWNIPAKWRVGSTGTEHSMTGWNQVFSIQANGTASVQKFGHSVTRTTNDVSTTY